LVDAVNDVGVDLNKSVSTLHLAGLLPFVAGMGFRKVVREGGRERGREGGRYLRWGLGRWSGREGGRGEGGGKVSFPLCDL